MKEETESHALKEVEKPLGISSLNKKTQKRLQEKSFRREGDGTRLDPKRVRGKDRWQ